MWGSRGREKGEGPLRVALLPVNALKQATNSVRTSNSDKSSEQQ